MICERCNKEIEDREWEEFGGICSKCDYKLNEEWDERGLE